MPHIVTMPQLGESVTEGTVTRWLKQVGDLVTADEPLLEVSTDKVDTELPAPVSGVLLAISVEIDSTVEVGAQLAVIGDAVEQSQFADLVPPTPVAAPDPTALEPVAVEPAAVEPETVVAPVAVAPIVSAPVPAPIATGSPEPAPAVVTAPVAAPAATAVATEPDGAYVTPLVRRLAADNDLDLAAVVGTGVGGRIRREDVLAAAEEATARRAAATTSTPVTVGGADTSTEPGDRTEKLSRLRRLIADRMLESITTTAQLTTVIEVDLTRVAALRNRFKVQFAEREGVKLTYLPFIAKAAIEALKLYPVLNAEMDAAAGTITYHDNTHLGIAVDTPRGLLVPVVRDADELNVAGLAHRIADLAERTRDNKVTPDELSGGTFTLTNTGSRGALFDTPILNIPQSAILGTGAVVKRPVVMTDESGSDVIAIRSMAFFAITYDHRLVDGADAARYLAAVKTRLEEGAYESDLH